MDSLPSTSTVRPFPLRGRRQTRGALRNPERIGHSEDHSSSTPGHSIPAAPPSQGACRREPVPSHASVPYHAERVFLNHMRFSRLPSGLSSRTPRLPWAQHCGTGRYRWDDRRHCIDRLLWTTLKVFISQKVDNCWISARFMKFHVVLPVKGGLGHRLVETRSGRPPD